MNPNLDDRPWSDDELDRTLDDLLQFGAAVVVPFAGRTRSHPQRRRWIAPLAAAAAVAAVLAAVTLPGSDGPGSTEAARSLSIRDGIADAGGVRFPVPPGWTVAVTAADDNSVTTCVAATPAADCEGVTVVMAVPDGPALPDSVTGNVMTGRCAGGSGGYVQVDPSIRLGGRNGVHYWGGSCSMDGPVAQAWITDDRALAITTPAGRWAAEGAAVAAGLDLATWARPAGTALPYRSAATSTASAITTTG